MFDTVLLRSFVAVVAEGGFTAAATRLNLTQSAVSAHVRRLESQIGHELLARTTRSVTLTADGELLLGYARAILKLNHDARAVLSRVPSEGAIRIGLSHDLADTRLMNVVQNFSERYPRIEFSARVGITAELLHALDQRELDVVVCGRCYDASDGRVLWREPLVWVGSEWASFAPGVPIPLAVLPEPCPYREAALAELARAGRDYRIVLVGSSATSLCAAAQAGLAVTPIAQSSLMQGLRVVTSEAGLPALPDVEFTISASAGPSTEVVGELGNAIARTFGQKS
ncbi:LysR substrate-binding domain-containing protein [Paraburkholderia sp. C35]|uniref:LysR substrate-binding domain-containing protein n=1 Tax=Paraburkholderia sp. C35 TaxID=2126993 RepID=UPI000D69C486|nr:LysR substrate-binding domain-containing protein [Paraburkholderia sp. C35]